MAEARRIALLCALSTAVAAGAATGCGQADAEVIYLARTGCEACHRPVRPDGTPEGIEKAHPDVDGEPLGCVACHGGDPEARKQSTAHVAPGLLDSGEVRSAGPLELDEQDPDYLRFINPGDLRVAPQACGCHQEVIDRVVRSPMATSAGEIDVTRYRAGMQPDEAGDLGIYDVFDPDHAASGAPLPGTVESLRAFAAAPVAADEQAVGPYQDLLLDKACLRCHLWSFGTNRFDGDYRSSGCSACHVVYADDGLSRSGDPMIDRGERGRPMRHELTTAIPTEQCAHCHNSPSHLGGAYRGWRPLGAPGTNPEPGVAVPLGQALHGHDPGYFLTDEDGRNEVDETPPDLHFEAGMHCVDCHAGSDVHGDGRIWTEGAAAVRVRCEHCHGSDERPALSGGPTTPTGLLLTRDDAGDTWLDGRVADRRWKVPQIAGGHGGFESMADHGRLRCDSCHSGWQNSCYGCHYTFDLSKVMASLRTGRTSPGRVAGAAGEVAIDSLVLMFDHEGRIAPSVPAERPHFTAVDGEGAEVFAGRVRTGPGGVAGMGQRTFAPHTTRRTGPFSACVRCHPKGDDDALARQAAGLGSGRFLWTDEAGVEHVLDRVVDPESYEPTVVVGHTGPERSRPLSEEVIRRMLGVTAP